MKSKNKDCAPQTLDMRRLDMIKGKSSVMHAGYELSEFIEAKKKKKKVLIVSSLFTLQWDEALLTMSAGEKAEITIEPEWAYGRKGIEGKYPFYQNTLYV